MRILVAGGAGFLGSHLCERLVEQGHHLLIVDNLLSGRLSNLSHFVGNRKIDFRHADVVNKIEGKFDRI